MFSAWKDEMVLTLRSCLEQLREKAKLFPVAPSLALGRRRLLRLVKTRTTLCSHRISSDFGVWTAIVPLRLLDQENGQYAAMGRAPYADAQEIFVTVSMTR
ncbi:hypothetical protein A6R68_04212 [Neotoma lepida]|uniref:Uncharacterized protein n=1 Tax=Neotoma lepida TaxID=56216 RepID=A0A1A6GNG5_NEOLE|nr:hypothetical protein A6R68_04212 [Neotoma lepida]